ncbi:cytochrome P450 [Tanacetum coccineum]
MISHSLVDQFQTWPILWTMINTLWWLPAGDQWRKLRRITKEYMFSLQHLDASEVLRKEKAQELVNYVAHSVISEKPVNIGEVVFTTTLNVLSNFMFSKDLAKYDSASAHEFRDAVWSLLELVGKPNLADFFPIFKPFDPQRLLRKANVYGMKIMAILDRIIDER